MTANPDNYSSQHEVHGDHNALAASIANLPQQEADKYDQIAMGEVSMPLEIGDEKVEHNPRNLHLVPDPKDPSRFSVFLHEHKKEVKLLGPATAAAILAGVAAIGYVKTKKK